MVIVHNSTHGNLQYTNSPPSLLPSLPPSPLSSPSAQLTQERELWQQASYDLAHKVAEEGGLRTVQRLQLCEKAWSKLAGHFAIILSNKDTQQACTPPPPYTHTHTHTLHAMACSVLWETEVALRTTNRSGKSLGEDRAFVFVMCSYLRCSGTCCSGGRRWQVYPRD